MSTKALIGQSICMPQAPLPTAGRPLVILIEDDNRVAHALSMLIEDWGYDCVAVRNPKTAAQRLGARMEDAIAIVVDLSRDDAFTGRRSAEAISTALGAEIPRIVTTNEPGEARTHGFTEVLGKPYDPEELRAWLRLQVANHVGGCKAK